MLIVVDQPEWAYHYIANYVIKHFSEKFDFYLDFTSFYLHSQKKTSFLKRLKHHIIKSYNKWRYQRIRRDQKYDVIYYSGYYMRKQYPKIMASKTILGIAVESFPPLCVGIGDENINLADFAKKYLNNVDVLVCGNHHTVDLYSSLDVPVLWANHWVSSEFYRLTPKKKNLSDKFIVGWSGKKNRQIKGYHDFVVPAVELAAKYRPGICLKTREFGPRKTLPRFYDDLDVVLIASESEGGPALFAEAACSCVPAISTRVGWPMMIIQDGVNGFLVDRNVEQMADRIVRLYDDRELLYSMSQKIYDDSNTVLGDEVQIKNWQRVFHAAGF